MIFVVYLPYNRFWKTTRVKLLGKAEQDKYKKTSGGSRFILTVKVPERSTLIRYVVHL